MNKINLYKIIGLAAAVAMLPVSCRQNGPVSVPVDVRISSEVDVKAQDNAFEPGDRVGLFMHDGTSVYYDNIMYSYYGEGFYGYERIFYPDGPEKLTFLAYYPYFDDRTVVPMSEFQWTVSDRQWDGRNYTDSDLMMAETTVETGTNPVNMALHHMMAAIDMVLVPGAGYTAGTLLESEISATINGVMNTCTVHTDGTVAATGETAGVEPYSSLQIKDGAVHGISAIVVPQTVPSGTRLLSISVNGTLYYYELGSDLTLNSSEKLVVKLKITDRGVEFSSEITGWNDAPVISGDLEEENSSVKDIDGNEYGFVTIGTQVWLTSDLKTTRLNDGTAIKQGGMMDYMSGNNIFYDINTVNGQSYYLYSYAAVASGKICPEGWRVPDNDDFSELMDILGSGAGKATKSTEGWTDGTASDPSYQGDGSTGLSVFPAGFGDSDKYGQKQGGGTTARLWSSSSPMFDYGYSFIWEYNSDGIEQDYRTTVRSSLSVRCIKE